MKRIMASVLINRHGVEVKGRGFASDRSRGSPIAQAQVHARREVDELALLFVHATADGKGPDLGIVEAIASSCFIPVAVGGGIRTVEQAAEVLSAGAEKIILGTSAFLTPGLVRQLADRFGSQAVVVSIDVENGHITTHSGRMRQEAYAEAYAEDCVEMGAGEILLQSVERDGTLQGYDLDLIERVCKRVKVPVIASGGCSGAVDMARALSHASAACAGALWSYTDDTPAKVKEIVSEWHEVRAA